MDKDRDIQKIMSKMEEIKEIVLKQIEENQKIKDIKYSDDLQLGQVGIEGAYTAEIESEEISKETGEKLRKVIYKVYGEDHTQIANIDEKGNVEFTDEYLNKLKEINERQLNSIQTRGVQLEEKKPEGKNEISYKEEKRKEDENRQIEEIAKQKNIPKNNVLKVRTDSNLYKNHPELKEEPNLYFYRDSDGKIKAEYIDEKGVVQPSKFFEESTTAFQKNVDIGQDGNPVKKEVPYQTMTTKLKHGDTDIKDTRINIEIVQGYLTIKESRQGKNGKWESHEIEVMGRDYNSKEVNDVTSTRLGGEADPSRVTNIFEKVEKTSLADDGVQMDEMQGYRENLINKFVNEGYNREEATRIYEYMVNEDRKLTEEQAKEKVNEEIRNNTDYGENEGGRTPGEDAYDRLTMRGKPY